MDGGIIVQSGSADLTGSALYHDKGASRWSVAKRLLLRVLQLHHWSLWSRLNNLAMMEPPETADVEYGVGEMFINDDGTIWIYS